MFSKKEFAIVSNLRFISMKNFMLSSVEHEKSFITSGPDCMNPQADLNLLGAMSECMFLMLKLTLILTWKRISYIKQIKTIKVVFGNKFHMKVCLFVLRFYSAVNPIWPCRVW